MLKIGFFTDHGILLSFTHPVFEVLEFFLLVQQSLKQTFDPVLILIKPLSSELNTFKQIFLLTD